MVSNSSLSVFLVVGVSGQSLERSWVLSLGSLLAVFASPEQMFILLSSFHERTPCLERGDFFETF